ncbi:putative permease SEO1 [Sugiyamaella lignohabitans]|uniref:Putative permease SEO1 n=1 Tax=Sugiyamaella lignohabitans TaxID=796027 RepID=A0A167CNR4_9ASCO|nr:putative permease SEO1 [Sugiyamaella lignohabitans]ANB11932.1 putative permease SEO1 [Sugiyamaella lignohabitans]
MPRIKKPGPLLSDPYSTIGYQAMSSSIESISKTAEYPVEERQLSSFDDVSEIEELERRKGWKYRLASVIWDSADKGKDERALLFKLDIFFLSSIMLGYFIKTLDMNNINTAYINGMQEDLKMKGSDLNLIQTCWTVGYIVGQFPSNLILHRVSPRYYLGALEIMWSILTVLRITCNTLPKMYAISFFIGLLEAGFFPAVEFLLGSWYLPDELTKRSTLFAVSGTAASMVTGYLQAAIIKTLSHKKLASYKYLFVLDAVISFPIALYTMVANPDTPAYTTSWYLNDRDKKIAIARTTKYSGAKHPPKRKIGKDTLKRTFSTWHIFLFPVIFLAFNNTCNSSSQPTFQSWLKSLGYTPVEYNVYPTAVNGAGIGFALVVAWISDAFNGLNWPFVLLYFFLQALGSLFLAIWHIPRGLHWFSYFLVGIPTAWGQPMIFAWVNRLLSGDTDKRLLTVTATNNLAYVTNAWVPILTWNAGDMPRYFIGFTYNATLAVVGFILTISAIFLERRDKQTRKISEAEAHSSEVQDA